MNTNEWIYTHIWSFQRAFEKLFVSISIIVLSFLQCLLSIFLPLFACWCVIDSLSVSWDKSKYGKEISRKCKPHYFLEQDHTYLVFFLLFFLPFNFLLCDVCIWSIIVKQNEKVNATQESREIKSHDWHCQTPNNPYMILLRGM